MSLRLFYYIRIGNLNIALSEKQHVQSYASEYDTVEKAFGDSVRFMATNFNFEKYRYRNVTADMGIQKGYFHSSLGAACISRYEVAYPEPDFIPHEGDEQSKNKDLIAKLLAPNPWMSKLDIARYTIKYQLLTGNCYWLKVRQGKKFVGWFPFNDTNITPYGTSDNFIEGYKFITYDGYLKEYAPEDVVHLPWLYINPIYPNRGISPGALADLEVDTDAKFGEYIAAYIANNARPAGMLKLDPKYAAINKAISVSKATTDKLKSAWQKRFSTKHAGQVGILPAGWEFQAIGSNLADLALDKARTTPETRTCALYLIPPEVAGVTSGLGHSTENNLAEARVRWLSSTLTPLWKFNASKFSAGIQEEYPGIELRYDIQNVQGIREMTNATLAGQAASLLGYVNAYLANNGDPTIREAARYIFNLTEEQAEQIFMPLPPRSETTVDTDGNLNEEDKNLTPDWWAGT